MDLLHLHQTPACIAVAVSGLVASLLGRPQASCGSCQHVQRLQTKAARVKER